MLTKQRKTIRAKRMVDFYKPHLKGKILDIGCGNGLLAAELQSLVCKLDLTGTDISYCSPPFKFKRCSEKALPFGDKEFDVSMLNDVLHHTPYDNQLNLIKEALRVSNKVLISEVPNNFIAKIMDIINNKTTKPPFTMRSLDGWLSLFKINNLKFRYGIMKKELIHPVDNYYFLIE